MIDVIVLVLWGAGRFLIVSGVQIIAEGDNDYGFIEEEGGLFSWRVGAV